MALPEFVARSVAVCSTLKLAPRADSSLLRIAVSGTLAWRRDVEAGPVALRITKQGLEAIAVEDAAVAAPEETPICAAAAPKVEITDEPAPHYELTKRVHVGTLACAHHREIKRFSGAKRLIENSKMRLG
jgi:hypothetical protein